MFAVTQQKTLPFFMAAILIATLMLALAPIAFAAPTVTTNQTAYAPGDTLNVSGTATPNSQVSIQVFNPSDVRKAIAQVTAGSTGAYSATGVYVFTAKDTAGTWTVKAYEAGITAEATFTVQAAPVTPPTVTTLEEVAGDVDVLKTDVNTIYSKLDTLNSKVLSLSAEIGTLSSGLENLKTLPADVAGLKALSADVADVKSDLASLSADVKTLKGTVNSLSTDVSALKGIKTDVDALKGNVGTLSSKVDSLSSDISSIKADINVLKTQPTAPPESMVTWAALAIAVVAIVLSAVTIVTSARKKK